MRRERLKDRIEDPRASLLDLLLRGAVAALCIGSVLYALIGRTPLVPARTASTKPAATPSDVSQVTLTATQNHGFYWDREGPIPLGDFGPRLAAWLKTARAPRITVTADNSALLGDALMLVEEARRQGIADVRIEARTRPSAP